MKEKFKYAMLLLLVTVLLIVPVSADWDYNTTYRYNFTLNVTNLSLSDDLTNVPIFIQISADSGLNSTDLTPIFDELGEKYTHMIIYNPDRQLHTCVEVEDWDAVSETAALWFRADFISKDNATQNMWQLYFDDDIADLMIVGEIGSECGNAVWNETYMAV